MNKIKWSGFASALLAAVFAMSTSPAGAQVLFQDGFNYTVGGNLGDNAPWGGGSTPDLAIGSGNLTYPGLADLGGNDLVLTSGVNIADTNIFSTTPLNSGTLYFSFLIEATSLPTAQYNTIGLDPLSGKPNPGATFAIYTGPTGGGWGVGLAINQGGQTTVAFPSVLSLNQPYLVVGVYNFALAPTFSIYVDPVPGGTQPTTGGVTETSKMVKTIATIQNIGLLSPSTASGGNYVLDNVMIGQSWASVTPAATPTPEPSTLALSAMGLLGLAVHYRRGRK
jgi:hypothetical protein